MEKLLSTWLDQAKESRHDIIICGQFIGGRHGESMQRPVATQLLGPILVVRFDGTERLVITDPSGIRLGDFQELIISSANDARYGWHYYGRPQSPENWIEKIYRKRNNEIQLIRTGNLKPKLETFIYEGNEFVKIL